MTHPHDEFIELDIHVRGYRDKAALVSRLFFDKKSGGLSTIPVDAERGVGKDTELAKHIAHQVSRGHYENITKE